MRTVLRQLTFATGLLLAAAAYGQVEPEISFEIKGGNFMPSASDWSAYYGGDSVDYIEVGAAYKPYRQIDVALNVGRLRASGMGGTTGSPHSVPFEYELIPIHALIIWRGVFSEDQIFVPFVGGGVSRLGYTEHTSNQPTVSGSAHGNHLRAGVQIRIGGAASGNLEAEQERRLKHAYLFVEYQVTSAMKDGVDLGGTALLGGLLFEF